MRGDKDHDGATVDLVTDFPLSLLIAGRTTGPDAGLYLATRDAAGFRVELRDHVAGLNALCRHPLLPLAYGVAEDPEVALYVWSLAGPTPVRLARIVLDLDREPCDVAVSPDGRQLAAVAFGNGGDGGLAWLQLRDDGMPEAAVAQVGAHDAIHPHQAVHLGGQWWVTDFGGDRLRRYIVDATGPTQLPSVPVPTGTAPRHLAPLRQQGRGQLVAVSGELGESVLVGDLASDDVEWRCVPSTALTGPASTRSTRNYPGDIKATADGRRVYVTNRGYDTIGVFDVDAGVPVPRGEVLLHAPSSRSGVTPDGGGHRPLWPQHLLVRGDEVLVACWDSSEVIQVRESGGVLGWESVLGCPGASWLLDVTDWVVPALEREMRRQAAEQDAAILRERGAADDLDELVAWSVTRVTVED